MDRVLPTQHFHVVFTVPVQLRPIARANPAWMYKALFDAARITLVTLGKQRLGTKDAAPVLGVTAVLHTWTKGLHLHPHLRSFQFTLRSSPPVVSTGIADDGSHRSHDFCFRLR